MTRCNCRDCEACVCGLSLWGARQVDPDCTVHARRPR